MYLGEDHTYGDMIRNSSLQWLSELSESDDIVNKQGAKLTLEYVEYLNKKIKELESKNALKDGFLKKLKSKVSQS